MELAFWFVVIVVGVAYAVLLSIMSDHNLLSMIVVILTLILFTLICRL